MSIHHNYFLPHLLQWYWVMEYLAARQQGLQSFAMQYLQRYPTMQFVKFPEMCSNICINSICSFISSETLVCSLALSIEELVPLTSL